MTAEALNCPNCGAGVASDSTQCEFCKTRLKTMACPSCFGLMFIGSKFCGHCGAVAAPIEVEATEDAGDCPRCRSALEALQIGGTRIHGCAKCDGLWVDPSTFESVCADQERQSAVLGFLEKRGLQPQAMTKIAYVPCPDCRQLMNRNNFAKASGVIVDICKPHGIWFDADELPSIIEFIHKGGMEIARQREKRELEEQRDQIREEQRKLGIENRRFGGNALTRDDETGIKGFIGNLFDRSLCNESCQELVFCFLCCCSRRYWLYRKTQLPYGTRSERGSSWLGCSSGRTPRVLTHFPRKTGATRSF